MKRFKMDANKFFKQLFCLALCAVTLLGLIPTPEARAADGYTVVNKEISATDFAETPTLQKYLQEIFDGDIPLYHKYDANGNQYDKNNKCIKKAKIDPSEAKLGKDPVHDSSKKKYQYLVGEEGKVRYNAGTSCWIYANAVYMKLFGEVVVTYDAGKSAFGEIKNTGKSTGNSKQVTASKNEINYENFKKWGISFGAYIRSISHSWIVLSYDENGVYSLEGNYNGNGAVGVLYTEWKQFKNQKEAHRYTDYIVQPTEKYFEKLFPGETYSAENHMSKERTLSYNLNGGTGSFPSQSGKEKATTTINKAIPKRAMSFWAGVPAQPPKKSNMLLEQPSFFQIRIPLFTPCGEQMK